MSQEPVRQESWVTNQSGKNHGSQTSQARIMGHKPVRQESWVTNQSGLNHGSHKPVRQGSPGRISAGLRLLDGGPYGIGRAAARNTTVPGISAEAVVRDAGRRLGIDRTDGWGQRLPGPDTDLWLRSRRAEEGVIGRCAWLGRTCEGIVAPRLHRCDASSMSRKKVMIRNRKGRRNHARSSSRWKSRSA